MSVAAPFVWRCLSGSTMAPFPHPAHRTGQADFPHPALGQDFTLARATPSAASEHLLELIGFPISRFVPARASCRHPAHRFASPVPNLHGLEIADRREAYHPPP